MLSYVLPGRKLDVWSTLPPVKNPYLTYISIPKQFLNIYLFFRSIWMNQDRLLMGLPLPVVSKDMVRAVAVAAPMFLHNEFGGEKFKDVNYLKWSLISSFVLLFYTLKCFVFEVLS